MKNFYTKLKEKTLANNKQKNTELWDVEGILHNQKFKFDLRPIKKNAKGGISVAHNIENGFPPTEIINNIAKLLAINVTAHAVTLTLPDL